MDTKKSKIDIGEKITSSTNVSSQVGWLNKEEFKQNNFYQPVQNSTPDGSRIST